MWSPRQPGGGKRALLRRDHQCTDLVTCTGVSHSQYILYWLELPGPGSINYSLVRLLVGKNVERCVRIMRYEIEKHSLFHLAAEPEELHSRRCCINKHHAMC